MSDTSVEEPTGEEVKEFFASLSRRKPNQSLVEPYADDYIPKSLNESLPLCLLQIYNPDTILINYGELLHAVL